MSIKTFWHISGLHSICLLRSERHRVGCELKWVLRKQCQHDWSVDRWMTKSKKHSKYTDILSHECAYKKTKQNNNWSGIEKKVSNHEYPLWFVTLFTNWSLEWSLIYQKVKMTPYAPICPALSTHKLDYYIGGNCKVSAGKVFTWLSLRRGFLKTEIPAFTFNKSNLEFASRQYVWISRGNLYSRLFIKIQFHKPSTVAIEKINTIFNNTKEVCQSMQI